MSSVQVAPGSANLNSQICMAQKQ